VDDGGATISGGAHLLTKTGEVGGKYRRCQLDQNCDLSETWVRQGNCLRKF
jgi:hypothetical protein